MAIRAFSLFGEIELRDGKLKSGMQSATREFAQFESQAKSHLKNVENSFAKFGSNFNQGFLSSFGIQRGSGIGSLLGSVLMIIVFALGFNAPRSILKLSLLLFITNSAGYFLGSAVNDCVGGRPGMLLWGAIYGLLLLGSGISALLFLLQVERTPSNVL